VGAMAAAAVAVGVRQHRGELPGSRDADDRPE
jgi:hypothetical protein